MTLRQLAEPLQELIGRDEIAALALDRLDDDRGDFIGRDEVDEDLLVDEVETFRGAVAGVGPLNLDLGG